ncbi:hypothetical protein [Paraglaciecola sp. MB-3u-78]|uniref:hypothetical protein n=1 Tax=Paraglaciecola sp. MB-3u-78 TaxID=2058332 RepID=UPI0012FF382A|nr:hypothetical protein [Paraglaciecola sp. MB-3u-78]
MSGCFEVFSSSFDGHQYQFVLEAVCRLSAISRNREGFGDRQLAASREKRN